MKFTGVEISSWKGNLLNWSDVIDGDVTVSSNTDFHGSISDKYRIAKSKYSNGYYIITEENYQAKIDKYIFVAAKVLSGSNSGGFWCFRTNEGTLTKNKYEIGLSKSNSDILLSSITNYDSSSITFAIHWVRNSGGNKGTNNPKCPTEINGVENVGNCDLPVSQTLYTIWQLRNFLPNIKSASGASSNNNWPTGSYGGSVWTSNWAGKNNNANLINNAGGHGQYSGNNNYGVIAVKELGY